MLCYDLGIIFSGISMFCILCVLLFCPYYSGILTFGISFRSSFLVFFLLFFCHKAETLDM